MRMISPRSWSRSQASRKKPVGPGPARSGGNAVLPWPVCGCRDGGKRRHRVRRCGRGLGGSCPPSALHGARRCRVPAVFGVGSLVSRLSRRCPEKAGLALAQRLAHASGLAFALIWAADVHIVRREFDVARTGEPRRRSRSPASIACRRGSGMQLYAGALLWSGLVSRQEGSRKFRPG